MEKIFIMINGLPGKVACTMAGAALADPRFTVLPLSLTGQDILEETFAMGAARFSLVKPDIRDKAIQKVQQQYPFFIAIDYTHPSAVNENARFYARNNIPFVMGTTGGNRKELEQTVNQAAQPAVIAPNMAKQIVGFQAMMEYAANTFPGLFAGYTLEVKESHQQAKADTSGTAKAMVGYFNALGLDFTPEDIEQIRDPIIQEKQWGIPREHLSGHGWHTYTLRAQDGSSLFEFKHNINGRDIYVSGTFDAVVFLRSKLGKRGKQLYTMIDVLNQT